MDLWYPPKKQTLQVEFAQLPVVIARQHPDLSAQGSDDVDYDDDGDNDEDGADDDADEDDNDEDDDDDVDDDADDADDDGDW